jgi:glycerol-3-phosphate dehydrogenase
MIYDVVVIGGGATGTAVFRDLAYRGLKAALIERGNLASGCTKNSHQNLVSGMRYVVKDPEVARECASENVILLNIAPHLIYGKANYWVGWKNSYFSRAMAAARELGVVAEQVDIGEVYKEIPSLASGFEVAIKTADRNIDATGFCKANLKSGLSKGGDYFPQTELNEIINLEEGFQLKAEGLDLKSKLVVNATGAWANDVLKKLDTSISLCYNQGTIIVQEALSSRGLQLLEMPGNGQAYIVHEGRAWLGTTSKDLEDPSQVGPEEGAEEVLKMKLAKIIPGVVDRKVDAAFSGVRPLYAGEEEEGRELSRDFQVIEEPNGVFTVVGGKLTTARLMAEKVVDKICVRLDCSITCVTHKELLPRLDDE